MQGPQAGRPADPARAPLAVETLGEMAAASAYLQLLSERISVADLPGERDADAIPPPTLAAIGRACRSIERHCGRALHAMSPRRAGAVGEIAAHARHVARHRASRP